MARFVYTGPRLSTGEPERSLIYSGIPAGDLDGETLTAEQRAIVRASNLYDERKPGRTQRTMTDTPPDGSGEQEDAHGL